MNGRRRVLGRGLGALIPTDPGTTARPVDVFFRQRAEGAATALGPTEPSDGQEALHSQLTVEGRTHHAPDSSANGHEASALREVPGARFAEIPVGAIRPNPRQPRTSFDQDELAELAYSVREIGILQPVVVRPSAAAGEDGTQSSHYELVMGERRWRAAQAAGLDFVPAIIKATQDDSLLRDALLENLHRTALNPLEEAAAYQQLLDDFGCTKEELATRIGKSRPQISNTLRLLRLPPSVQRRVAAGVLSAGHARALLVLEDAVAMEHLAQRIVAEGLSVRNVEETVAIGAEAPARTRARRTSRVLQLDDVAARLSDRFDTRVQVSLTRRKGRLTVEFAGRDDLNRILNIMGVPTVDTGPKWELGNDH